MPEKVPMSKTAARSAAVFKLFKILDRGGGGGGVFVTSPVIGGLTLSDYFALTEHAALLPCKPRPLVFSDD